MYPHIPVTSEMLECAELQSREMGPLYGSIRKGEGNVIGFLGELAAVQYIGIPQANTKDYDLLSDGGLRIDVKSKQTSVVPKGNYDASVWAGNTDQACDIYLFTRVLCNGKGKSALPVEVYLMGWLPKTTYYERAQFAKKGDWQTSQFQYRADCYNLPYDQMYPWRGEEDVWQHLTA